MTQCPQSSFEFEAHFCREAAACVLAEALRRLALKGTEMAEAQANTIRLRLLKIGAPIRFTARRVVVSMATGHAWQGLFGHAWKALRI